MPQISFLRPGLPTRAFVFFVSFARVEERLDPTAPAGKIADQAAPATSRSSASRHRAPTLGPLNSPLTTRPVSAS